MSMLSKQVKELRELANSKELEMHEPVTYGFYGKIKSKLFRAADTIEALSAKLQEANMERSDRYYNGGWIACEDRLPPQPKENPIFDGKPLELYLVSVKNTDYAFRAFWNGNFFTDGFSKLQNVEAWQPLTEPYHP